jgi:hypothetical protein
MNLPLKKYFHDGFQRYQITKGLRSMLADPKFWGRGGILVANVKNDDGRGGFVSCSFPFINLEKELNEKDSLFMECLADVVKEREDLILINWQTHPAVALRKDYDALRKGGDERLRESLSYNEEQGIIVKGGK